MKKQTNTYAFIDLGQEKDDSVLFTGNFVPLDPECEIFDILRSAGIKEVREMLSCRTYEDYQKLGKCRIALGMRYSSDKNIRYFEEQLEMPYFSFPASYDADIIRKGYEHICEMLGAGIPDTKEMYEKAVDHAKETAELLNGLEIAIDSSGAMRPFAAALALLKYGFNIRYIVRRNNKLMFDQEEVDIVERTHPEIKILYRDSYKEAFPEEGKNDILAIGTDAKRILGTKYCANIWHDEGYFGFHGIVKLMNTIREAVGING